MKNIILLIVVSAISACSTAPKSTEVRAAYVPTSSYQYMTCDQLISEAEAVRRSVPGLEAAVDNHRTQQTGVEVITWLFFWPAAFALDKGEATSSQLARAKGEMDAISLAMRSKKCG